MQMKCHLGAVDVVEANSDVAVQVEVGGADEPKYHRLPNRVVVFPVRYEIDFGPTGGLRNGATETAKTLLYLHLLRNFSR